MHRWQGRCLKPLSRAPVAQIFGWAEAAKCIGRRQPTHFVSLIVQAREAVWSLSRATNRVTVLFRLGQPCHELLYCALRLEGSRGPLDFLYLLLEIGHVLFELIALLCLLLLFFLELLAQKCFEIGRLFRLKGCLENIDTIFQVLQTMIKLRVLRALLGIHNCLLNMLRQLFESILLVPESGRIFVILV